MSTEKNVYHLDQYLSAQTELIYISPILKQFMINLKAGERKECGSEIPPEVSFYVARGEGTIFVGDEALHVKEGDLVVCPKGKHHAFTTDRDQFSILVTLPLNQ